MFRHFLYQSVISFYIVDFDINELVRDIVYDRLLPPCLIQVADPI